MSSNSGAAESISSSISPDGSPTLESFYSKFHHLKRILEEDSSSDSSSLFSSNSDEGSCSTDSTRDSTSTDDFSDYIFGDSGHGWSNAWRNSDSDTSSSSSSPLNWIVDIRPYPKWTSTIQFLQTPQVQMRRQIVLYSVTNGGMLSGGVAVFLICILTQFYSIEN